VQTQYICVSNKHITVTILLHRQEDVAPTTRETP